MSTRHTFPFTIITPQGKVFEGGVESVMATGTLGGFGVWARHAPMVTSLVPGPLMIREDGTERHFAVSSGVLEVNDQSAVVLLADSVWEAESLDAAKNAADELKIA